MGLQSLIFSGLSADLKGEMKRSTALAIALPGLAGAAAVRHYVGALREFDSAACQSPVIPGVLRSVETDWGRISYRRVDGDPGSAPVVLVHGWGRTADSAWWPILGQTRRTVIAIDLPGHGRSLSERRFTFGLAAEAVLAATDHAGFEAPLLVGHSMGGAVGLTTFLWSGPERYRGFLALATSAYWVQPRQSFMLTAAPWVLGPRSPWTIRRELREIDRLPGEGTRIAWEYAVRPGRQVLVDSALELRRFDARRWNELRLPPTTWVVTTRDSVIPAAHQRISAVALGARRVELACEHSAVIEDPERVCRIIDAAADRPDGAILVAI